MRNKGYKPSFWDRPLDRAARKSWMPAPFPWLSLAVGTAAGILFAYSMQDAGYLSADVMLDRLGQALVLALG
jgi:hypothetical protein